MVTFLMVAGGLALFLYGVKMLSQGMERLAGGQLQAWLDRATNRPLKGATFGAVATALLQSSSLLMVTMIGLINANLLSLEQAIGVMLGQEIGTTLTGQMIAFNVGDIRFLAIAVGFLLLEFGKERKWRGYGQAILGFGIIFTGMETMSAALKPLAATPIASQFLTQMGQNPLLGVLAGAVLTALIQSSSATTALVIAMGTSGIITLPGAIGLIYGANIGTCVTGLIASTRSTVPARRASIAQIIINIAGVLLFLPFITPYASLLKHTSMYLPRQIANAHTVFNIAVSAVLFPFITPIRKLTEVLIPEHAQARTLKVTRFIDDATRGVPSMAIMGAHRELERMGTTALQMLELSQNALVNQDDDDAQQVLRLERELVDPLCDAIEQFVDGVISDDLDSSERKLCFQIKNVNVDLERVADHCENMAEAAQDRIYHKVPFSDEAVRDLDRVFEHAQKTLATALKAFSLDEHELGLQACRLEDEMDHITLSTRQNHMNRMEKGYCHPEAGVLFIETLRNLERIGDHADNVALTVLRKR